MAKFIIAYNLTAVNEGGYANDLTDAGGETWKGVARKKHPNWAGWSIIDQFVIFPKPTMKESWKHVDKLLNTLPKLQELVLKFYEDVFWDEIRGNEIINQEVANSLYDSAINFGQSVAIKLAQKAAGLEETGKMNDTILKSLNNQL